MTALGKAMKAAKRAARARKHTATKKRRAAKHTIQKLSSIITLITDFGLGTHGIGVMEGVIASINPKARVIHLAHGIPDFDLRSAAKELEAAQSLPPSIHVVVVDPGVGTARKPIAILTGRGDVLIGPDNGVLLPACRFLGGIVKSYEIENRSVMAPLISPVFHGRDIFAPAAAHISKGFQLQRLGRELKKLAAPPYPEAVYENGMISAELIYINKFGSAHLNLLQKEFARLGLKKGQHINVRLKYKTISLPFASTFGEVHSQGELIMPDDFGRVELAVNRGSFVSRYPLRIGEKVALWKAKKLQ